MTFDELDVARMSGALSAYDEAIRVAEAEMERHMPHMADWRAANEIAYQLRGARYRFSEVCKKKANNLALDGAITAAMKKKRARKRAQAN